MLNEGEPRPHCGPYTYPCNPGRAGMSMAQAKTMLPLPTRQAMTGQSPGSLPSSFLSAGEKPPPDLDSYVLLTSVLNQHMEMQLRPPVCIQHCPRGVLPKESATGQTG